MTDGMSAACAEPSFTQLVTRTLVAAGYTPRGAYPHPHGIELKAERLDAFGCARCYRFVLRGKSETPVSLDLRRAIEAEAREDLSAVVWIAEASPLASFEIALEDFLNRLGGAVPTWRSLAPSYHSELLAASRLGSRWADFEALVADGLEFLFGRRVRRLGHKQPGERVPDIIVSTPDHGVYVVDTKSASAGFGADWDNLRPLGEYVQLVRQRQAGQLAALNGALIVSSAFRQQDPDLLDVAAQFNATHNLMPTFLQADDLSAMVQTVSSQVPIRNAIRWRLLLRGGRFNRTTFDRELAAIRRERISDAD